MATTVSGPSKLPTYCPFCASSSLAIVDWHVGEHLTMGKYQEIKIDHNIMCQYCHRIFKINLIGWQES